MVAGMVFAIANELPPQEFLPTAMATAAASVILEGTQMCSAEGFFEMKKLVPKIVRVGIQM
jgi:fructose-1-phosphate kinase PfkB-like protein